MARAIVAKIARDRVSEEAQTESRNREVYLPPVGVYRWWARRTGAVNSAVVQAAEDVLGSGKPLLVADPFAGGGVIPLVALRAGHEVYAQDLNPWATEGLLAASRALDKQELEVAIDALLSGGSALMQRAYATNFNDGAPATLSHTFRVAVGACPTCNSRARLFPHALLTRVDRKDTSKGQLKSARAFIACPEGHLYLGHATKRSQCPECGKRTSPERSYLSERRFHCSQCGETHSLSAMAAHQAFDWEIVLVERCAGSRRELDRPRPAEIDLARSRNWTTRAPDNDEIPELPETAVLRRHGLTRWSSLYPLRQRWIIQELLALVDRLNTSEEIRAALRVTVLGTIEMAGHMSRWDRHYLKSFESMASHRFNFTTFSVETNLIGVECRGRGSLVNRLAMLRKSNNWLHENRSCKSTFALDSTRDTLPRRTARAGLTVVRGNSDRLLLRDQSVDLILTDPPYHDDVQYHDLSLPFRIWGGLPVDRATGEAVAVPHSKTLENHRCYRDQLASIFKEFRRVLKPTGRLVFSYANREPAAWVNLFAALREASLEPLAYTIVHAENETEVGKRKRRSCTLDLLLELTRSNRRSVAQWRPKINPETDEEAYLIAVGNAFLDSSKLLNGWERDLVTELSSFDFLVPRSQSRDVENSPTVA